MIGNRDGDKVGGGKGGRSEVVTPHRALSGLRRRVAVADGGL